MSQQPPAGREPHVITSELLFSALLEADVVRSSDNVSRIVIDCQAGHAARIYVERHGDERLLSVVPSLDGIEISGVPADSRPGGM